MAFAPRKVRLGTRTELALIPHWNEFDQEALFLNALEYEAPVCRWLEDNVGATYDLILEIGANAGLNSVFFDALFKRDAGATKRTIVSFEPSPEAYRRLIANVTANQAHRVIPYQAAVGDRSGLQVFYEPVGHSTNGSLLRQFSEIFSGEIDETIVMVVGAHELERWFATAARTLVKIDVEGFEPELIVALGSFMERHRPDLLIEVPPFALEKLNASPELMAYEKYLIQPDGLQKSDAFHASEQHRDWLLRWPSAVSIQGVV